MSPSTARGIGSRTAAAPISWGVCEVPGWGHQLSAPRVLSEMASLGLAATEFGPEGFLPACPDERTAVLAGHGLTPVGGFVPVVLHDAERDPLAGIAGVLEEFARSGAGTLVVAAATGLHGYDARPVLGGDGWRTLLDNLERIAAAASRHGMTAVLHPHVGTMVESAPEVDRVLEGSGIGLCLDTGHLLAGGADPVALARRAGRPPAAAPPEEVARGGRPAPPPRARG
ncbi:sugar phosphate isomerase/epimerase family protein [Streptomyces sp. NPDC059506]|uniref:sugar phosphate isomerase/epimerase family protein n=1 Tax=Streptomyces sp. NPDC059506 TaxID=3347751 RepID=UPI00368024B8